MSIVREAEREARQLLETSWWTSEEYAQPLPIDPFSLAIGQGIQVRFDHKLPPNQSGKIVIQPKVAPVITINASDSLNRQRFTAGHEIGHYLRTKDRQTNETIIDYRDTLAGLGVDSKEIFANQFAAALLMPAEVVEWYNNKDYTVGQIALRLGTSAQALSIRLRNLGLSSH